jgi:hypothetical protein
MVKAWVNPAANFLRILNGQAERRTGELTVNCGALGGSPACAPRGLSRHRTALL